MEIIKEIKGVFIPPVKKYYLGWIKNYTPYFEPMGFCDTIIKVRKLIPLSEEKLAENAKRGGGWAKEKYSNMPMVRRSKNWVVELFGNHYYIRIGYPLKFHRNELGWKDKWNSPRFEWNPSYQIWFFKWQFTIHWVAPQVEKHIASKPFIVEDTYWEMVLWYVKYCDKDIKKAQESWGWSDYDTKISTWNPNYLI